MIRVSTTTIEQYRRVLTTEYATEAELIEQIKGKFTPTWQMEAGTAWDRLLTIGSAKAKVVDGRAFCGAFSFDTAHLQVAADHIGPGIWQVKATKVLDPFDVVVVAQADHCRGLFIQENKAKFSTPDARDYEQALQWRFYLWVHGAAQVRYNLFDFSDPKAGYCELRNIVSFSFWDYPGLEADCRRWVLDFVAWAASKDLLSYLDREGSTPVAA